MVMKKALVVTLVVSPWLALAILVGGMFADRKLKHLLEVN